MIQVNFILMALVGLLVTVALIPLIIKVARRHHLNNRAMDLHHTHESPISRFGGIALALAFVVVDLCSRKLLGEAPHLDGTNAIVLASSLAMFAVGFWDDVKPLGAKRKLGFQIIIALTVYWLGIGIHNFRIPFFGTIIDLGGWGCFLTVVWLIAVPNLINLIDGADGLAGGICLMLMILIACIGHQSGSFEMMGAGMAGALVGFLCFNFPPARIYLGDGGAYFLGFLIALIALVNSHKGEVFGALTAPMFVLALPITDASLAILRRGLRGLPVFRPDRRHIHHHLLNMGFSRRRVVLSFYAVTLVFLVLGLMAFTLRSRWVLGLSGLTLVILVACAKKLSFSRPWFAVGRVISHSLGMRKEVRYALSLTQLLGMEGGRLQSLEELWEQLIFTTSRLGFTTVKLSYSDFHRVWKTDDVGKPRFNVRYELRGGHAGTIELGSHSKPASEAEQPTEDQTPNTARVTRFNAIADEKLFAILSELVAEGWLKAITQWGQRQFTDAESGSLPLVVQNDSECKTIS